MTMQVIQHIELGSAAANIEFTSIPNTFTDLLVKISSRSSGGTSPNVPSFEVRFNSSTTGYTGRVLGGDGSSVFSSSPTYGYAASHPGNFMTSNTFSSTEIYIPNYAGSTNKSYSVDGVAENNAANSIQAIVSGLWSNTAAITSILLKDRDGNNLAGGSSATLYGITKGSDGTTTVS